MNPTSSPTLPGTGDPLFLGEESFFALAETLPQLVFVVDAEGAPVYFNRRWKEYTGEEPGRLEERLRRIHPEDRARMVDLWQAAVRTASAFEGECRLLGRRGDYRWFLVRSYPMRDSSGKVRQWFGTSTDIHDLKLSEDTQRQAREQTSWLGRFPDQNPEPVLCLSAEGQVKYANPAARSLFAEFGLEDGHPAPPEMLAPARESLERGGQVRRELTSGGRSFALTFCPGEVGVNVYGHDISDFTRVEAALREADRKKNDFLSVLSHELRNPLAAITSSLYVLDGTIPKGHVREPNRALAVIRRQVSQLTRLVDDLLGATRVAMGQIRLKPERLDLRGLVEKVVEDHRAFLEEKGLRLSFDLPGSPVSVDADPTWLAQAIAGLLDNARRFTDGGGSVQVVVGIDPVACQALVRVRDTGIGMAAETIACLFQPFMQANQGLDHPKGGLGLGLSLVRRLMRLHGGDITASSEGPGLGSEFEMRLPLAPTQASGTVVAGDSASRDVEPGPHRVLIIEDSIDTADSLRAALELMRHEVAVAHDGHQGLAAARAWRPDFVLCDIGLPGLDGYEVARAIRADEALKGIRLVSLSGYALPEDIERASAAGFDRHIAKPPDLRELAEVLSRGRPQQPPGRSAATAHDAQAPGAPAHDAPVLAAVTVSAATSAEAGLKVLLIEDNPGDADLAREALADDAGCWQIKHVGRLSEGFATLRSEDVDVVVLDLSLPDASGLQGVTELTRLRPEVPVVVLTGMSDTEAGARAVQAGAQEYLMKGEFPGRTLGRALRHAIVRHALAERSKSLAQDLAGKMAEEAARQRALLLAEASIAVSSTLDEEEALVRLGRALVPRLASICAVELVDAEDGPRCLIAVSGGDGDLREYDLRAPDPASAKASAQALLERCSLGPRVEAAPAEPVVGWPAGCERGPQAPGLGWTMTLPLQVRDQALGTLTLFAASEFGPDDLAVGEEIARRAATSIDSARLYAQAIDAVRIRDDFISIAGHELRTPLASLLLDVHRIRASGEVDQEALRRTLDRIARSGERIKALVGDLLDVSRIRAGRFLLSLSEVDLETVVRDVADRYQSALSSAGSELRLRVKAPVRGLWDHSRLEQVTANLLQNAIRYGAGKPIEITIEEDSGVARMVVRDHGCGIAPADQERIFEQFSRPSAASKPDGLGLGLWITRGIVAAHGGTVSVDSRPGQGAALRVELPCAGPPAAESAVSAG